MQKFIKNHFVNKVSLDKFLKTNWMSAASAATIAFHAEAAHAKSILGVNGQLDFGPLAGD